MKLALWESTNPQQEHQTAPVVLPELTNQVQDQTPLPTAFPVLQELIHRQLHSCARAVPQEGTNRLHSLQTVPNVHQDYMAHRRAWRSQLAPAHALLVSMRCQAQAHASTAQRASFRSEMLDPVPIAALEPTAQLRVSCSPHAMENVHQGNILLPPLPRVRSVHWDISRPTPELQIAQRAWSDFTPPRWAQRGNARLARAGPPP